MAKKNYAFKIEEILVDSIPMPNKSRFMELCLEIGLSEWERMKVESTVSTLRRICNATVDDRELATKFEEYPGQVK